MRFFSQPLYRTTKPIHGCTHQPAHYSRAKQRKTRCARQHKQTRCACLPVEGGDIINEGSAVGLVNVIHAAFYARFNHARRVFAIGLKRPEGIEQAT